jgi:hypothetical protein
MDKFKLGFGPMSKDIVDILCKHSVENNYPLMIIASRNQVDYDCLLYTSDAADEG